MTKQKRQFTTLDKKGQINAILQKKYGAYTCVKLMGRYALLQGEMLPKWFDFNGALAFANALEDLPAEDEDGKIDITAMSTAERDRLLAQMMGNSANNSSQIAKMRRGK